MAPLTRIAVFCPEYFLPYSQTFIYDELRALTRYEADVFALGLRNETRFPYPRVHIPHGLRQRLRYLATARCAAFDDVLRSRKPELVHAQFGTSGVFAYPYARRLGLPLVVTFHGYDLAILNGYTRGLPQRWPYWAVSRRMLRDAAVLLCASQELCRIASQLSGRPHAVRLHRLGVDVARFARPRAQRHTPEVAMIGRFVEKKGYRYGIEAFARATRATPARLTLVGAGPLERAYRKQVRELGLQAQVRFAGVLDSEAVAELLSHTDVLLAPSCVARNGDRESGLMVVREAGAAGVPVIGTLHGGIPETIDDGATGYLVAERDTAGMALRLEELLASPALRQRMGGAAHQKVSSELGLGGQVGRLEAIYDEVLGQRPR